jgi:hypothetical protein
LIHTSVDNFVFEVLLPFLLGLYIVLHDQCSLLVRICTIWCKNLLLLILIDCRSASRHRRQILFRSHLHRFNLLLLRLLLILVHVTPIVLMGQLRLYKIHLWSELCSLFELVLLPHIHSRLVHFLRGDPTLNIDLFLWISIMKRTLDISFVIVLFPPRRAKGCIYESVIIVRIHQGWKMVRMNHRPSLILDILLESHRRELLHVIWISSLVTWSSVSLIVSFLSLAIVKAFSILSQLHNHLLLFIMDIVWLLRILLISFRNMWNLRGMVWC